MPVHPVVFSGLTEMLLIEQILNGLLVGSYYTLLALGLSIIFSLGGVVNLAHGAFYAFGAYLTVTITAQLGFPAAFLLTPVLVGIVGVLIEMTCIRKLYPKDPILTLLFTFGLAISAEQIFRLMFGASTIPFSIPEFLSGQIHIGDFLYSYYRLAILAVTSVAIAGLWLLFNKTHFGLVVRAGVEDAEMVRAMGISVKPILSIVFAIGVGLAAIAGSMSASLMGVQPAMGNEIIIAAFVICVLGGLGSFWGVVLAGLIVGVLKGVTALYFPPAAEGSMYALMVVVLIFRPRGLVGQRLARLE
ncbi:MAG: branched-chain amino acid ABC transporter permease [Gammaproteobacteria bacterium]|jgi:branched-chain amino acid transport system permease protein|nr:MAG: branched-chain amino acid ABC transporter permease [Gammaproteobacteria bacterium]